MTKTEQVKLKRNKKASLSDQQNKALLAFAKLETKDAIKQLGSSENGLNLGQIEPLREKYGYNTFSTKKKDNLLKKLISAFFNPFSIILMIIGVLTLITPLFAIGSIAASDWISFGIISAMIIISGVIKLFQEGRSSKASEKLKQMIKTTTAIKRNGVIKELPMEEVLPGDIIKLSAGDMIPADIRIISARDLFITQSSLTGESEPIEKFSYSITDEITSALECNNLCFMGTSVSSGSAIGIVVHTGRNTFFGSVAKALNRKTPKTNFDKGIASVS